MMLLIPTIFGCHKCAWGVSSAGADSGSIGTAELGCVSVDETHIKAGDTSSANRAIISAQSASSATSKVTRDFLIFARASRINEE